MTLLDIKTVKKAIIYGAFNNRCFMIKTTPHEFEELKITGVPVDEISVYETFISIICYVNAERTQDLILKAQDMGIQVKF